MHLVAIQLWRRLSDTIELRRLRRRLPSAHRAWSVTSGKHRPETDAEYLERLRALARERARRRDMKVATTPADNDQKGRAQTPDHEELSRALAALEGAMVALRARAETAEKRADAAEAHRQAAQARADYAAVERDEANRRADALKVLLDATQLELAGLRSLVAIASPDVQEANEAVQRRRGRPLRVAGGGSEQRTANGISGPIDSAKARVAVRPGAQVAATLRQGVGAHY
jgi:hypothetical protein